MTRSFILVSHAYCKDMDLYTATPQTLEPLPFRGMSRYPYPATRALPGHPESCVIFEKPTTPAWRNRPDSCCHEIRRCRLPD